MKNTVKISFRNIYVANYLDPTKCIGEEQAGVNGFHVNASPTATAVLNNGCQPQKKSAVLLRIIVGAVKLPPPASAIVVITADRIERIHASDRNAIGDAFKQPHRSEQ